MQVMMMDVVFLMQYMAIRKPYDIPCLNKALSTNGLFTYFKSSNAHSQDKSIDKKNCILRH